MPVADVARRILDTYPGEIALDRQLLIRCIEACSDCAEACTQCADACLREEIVHHLVKCIRLCMDCADVCTTTQRVVSRQTGYDANLTQAVLRACITTCRISGDECELHAIKHGMKHCRICAEECRLCEQACQELLDTIA